ncbi:MAG: FliA/WhiG family RNA polymerase sigma factor [Opitutales bacterium]
MNARLDLCETTDSAELLNHYYPLVQRVVNSMMRFLPANADREELHSVGLGGLVRALERYRPDRARTFAAYACLRIRGAILDELRRMDTLPRSSRHQLRQLEAAVQELEQRHGRAPTDAEIAAELGVSASELERLRQKATPSQLVSLDAPLPTGEDRSFHDTIADPDDRPVYGDLEHREQIAELVRQLEVLPDRQRRILAMYYNEGLRLADIAEAFGVTEARICQIHSQALATLRRRMSAVS